VCTFLQIIFGKGTNPYHTLYSYISNKQYSTHYLLKPGHTVASIHSIHWSSIGTTKQRAGVLSTLMYIRFVTYPCKLRTCRVNPLARHASSSLLAILHPAASQHPQQPYLLSMPCSLGKPCTFGQLYCFLNCNRL
jgi:hypothetical protein